MHYNLISIILTTVVVVLVVATAAALIAVLATIPAVTPATLADAILIEDAAVTAMDCTIIADLVLNSKKKKECVNRNLKGGHGVIIFCDYKGHTTGVTYCADAVVVAAACPAEATVADTELVVELPGAYTAAAVS